MKAGWRRRGAETAAHLSFARQDRISAANNDVTSSLCCSKMTMSVKAEPQKSTGVQECAGCGKKIQDRYADSNEPFRRVRTTFFLFSRLLLFPAGICSRLWTCIGTRTASSAAAATAGWARWDRRCTQRETSSFARGTTSGESLVRDPPKTPFCSSSISFLIPPGFRTNSPLVTFLPR